MTDLTTLIAEIEAGRGTDDQIAEYLGDPPYQWGDREYLNAASAALKMVPPGHILYLTYDRKEGASWACCAPPGFGGHQSSKRRRHLEGRAPEPARAIVIAALKARQNAV